MHADRELVWYAGIGAASERELDARELTALRRRTSRTLALALSAFALVPITIAFLLVVFALAELMAADRIIATDLAIGVTTFVIALYVLAGVPLSLAAGARALRLYRALRRDAEAGRVVVCTGRGSDFVAPVKTAKRLMRAGFSFERDGDIALEVLPGSGVLWTLNQRRPEETITLPRGATSETPEFAAIAAKWTRPLEIAGGAIEYNRRSLSAAEKSELQLYVPDISLKLVWLAALHVLLVYQIVRFVEGDVFYGVLAFFSSVIAFIADRRMLRLIQFQKSLRRDLEEGWVAIVKPRSHNDDPMTVIEYLPLTGAEWTTGGIPAAWRKMYGRFGE